MLVSPLPFDYAVHLDPHHDPSVRQRRLRNRPSGTRVRRTPGNAPE
jgi:hypothetical protein